MEERGECFLKSDLSMKKKNEKCYQAWKRGEKMCDICKEYQISSSTWYRWKKDWHLQENKSEVSERKKESIELLEKAKEGLEMNVDFLCSRLDEARDAQRQAQKLRERLRILGPKEKEEPENITKERANLQNQLDTYASLSDSSAATFLRSLMAITAKEQMVQKKQESSQKETYEQILNELLGDEF